MNTKDIYIVCFTSNNLDYLYKRTWFLCESLIDERSDKYTPNIHLKDGRSLIFTVDAMDGLEPNDLMLSYHAYLHYLDCYANELQFGVRVKNFKQYIKDKFGVEVKDEESS